MPRIEARTRLLLVAHQDEEHKPTNTGLLAARCLTNSSVVMIGGRNAPLRTSLLHEDERAVVLFPHDDAVPIERFADGAPLTLVVPDGTWRQASKALARVPGLSTLPRVALPACEPTRYRLRAEPREGGLATLEAIARALGALEGEAKVAPLLEIFALFVDRTLWLRGALADHEVTGGVPPEAVESGVRGHHAKAPPGTTRRGTEP